MIGIDVIVSIFIILGGIITFIFALGFSDMVNSLTESIFFPSQHDWLKFAPLIAFFAGIIAILYGVERLISNFFKL